MHEVGPLVKQAKQLTVELIDLLADILKRHDNRLSLTEFLASG
jgi:hypothetical protein